MEQGAGNAVMGDAEQAVRQAAEAVRAACLQAAIDGYERAGLGGLCEEGRWEMVVDSIRSLDIESLISNYLQQPSSR